MGNCFGKTRPQSYAATETENVRYPPPSRAVVSNGITSPIVSSASPRKPLHPIIKYQVQPTQIEHDVHSVVTYNPPAPTQQTPNGRSQIRVRALYSYTRHNHDDLNFEKGDVMVVLSDISDAWWLATHTVTGAIGYIPSNYVVIDDGKPTSLDAWFDISRRDADRKLLPGGIIKGAYIIRPSSDPRHYALSVRHFDTEKNMYVVKHYKIRSLDNNAGYFISSRTTFPNIGELIEYYRIVLSILV
ncbi:unnamed protein product [Protopolystoma xenopodis]|uniref:SH3 domain-containing protein n=1 Tax=Protopolystoma xenopodis TaxID=117903 RepID=A0A448WA19_9PLAT|nr:unnamed protein product [Protopolystoma xenopodis]